MPRLSHVPSAVGEVRLLKVSSVTSSTASTTGAQSGYSDESTAYFKRISDMNLSVPVLTGFGISDKVSYNQATEFSAGGIIGSAFVKALQESDNTSNAIESFVKKFK